MAYNFNARRPLQSMANKLKIGSNCFNSTTVSCCEECFVIANREKLFSFYTEI